MNSYRLVLYRGQPLKAVQKGVVNATNADVAAKRFLGGGVAANLKYATINEDDRVKLEPDETVAVYITRNW